MKKALAALAKVLLGFLGAILLTLLVLAVLALVGREDPAAFIPEDYLAYVQVPSLRGVYERWINLEAADRALARPEFASLRSALGEARGLALGDSPLASALLDMPADLLWLRDSRPLAVVNLGWRGIATPLVSLVGPHLRIPGLGHVNDSGRSLFRYAAGGTTVHAALRGNVAILALDAETLLEALRSRESRSGLAATAGPELMKRVRDRNPEGLRVLADTGRLASGLLGGSPLGARVLEAVRFPGRTILDLELDNESLRIGAGLPLGLAMPELEAVLRRPPPTLGVLRFVPASARLLTVSNLAPLRELYGLAAAFGGASLAAGFSEADAAARSLTGLGIEELLFSWAGTELGAFMLPGSEAPVLFLRIRDEAAYRAAFEALVRSAVVARDDSLVLDGTRLDRLFLPGFLRWILGIFRVELPEAFCLAREGFFFLSTEAANLAATARAADEGSNLAQEGLFAGLVKGLPADPRFLAWYDLDRERPAFLRGGGLLPEILGLYPRGLAILRASTEELELSLAAVRLPEAGAEALPGFPLSPEGGVPGEAVAFRFAAGGGPVLAWIGKGDTLVLADPGGAKLAEAGLEPDSRLLPEFDASGRALALWAASPGGTVWRFGPGLASLSPFPVATGIAGTMPPTLLAGRLALFSRADANLVLVAADGSLSRLPGRLEAPLLSPPALSGSTMAFYPKSFDSLIHLRDLAGRELPGWPVQASGISFCAPRFLGGGGEVVVTFLTQAGYLHAWRLDGSPAPWSPLGLPGTYYATAEPLRLGGEEVLAILSQDGGLSLVSATGGLLRQLRVPDLDGKEARILPLDLDRDGRDEILLHGSGAFIAGYDADLRPLPGFPLKGFSRPWAVDLDRDGRTDLVTAGLDGKLYAYRATGARR